MLLRTLLYFALMAQISVTSSCFRHGPSENNQKEALSAADSSSFDNIGNFKLNSVEDLYQFFTFTDHAYPLVSAHRGGPGADFPENAIETFAQASKARPIIIECDVRLSKDSILVLMHDETLDRTSNGSGKIGKYTLKELKELKLKDINGKLTAIKIPTLEEALAWGKGKAIFTLDVKNDVPYSLLADLISKMNAAPYSIVITYSADQARALHKVDPDLMISASIRNIDDLSRLVENDIPANRLVAFVGIRMPEKILINRLNQYGIMTILGTIGNLDRQADSRGYQVYAEFIEQGINILSTDRPEQAQKALDFYIQKRNITSPFINN